MNRIITLTILTLFATMGYAQNLEEEIGFKYVKAEYLLQTERLEDAIKELNDVIKSNPAYKNALLMRATIKYRLAAYKGAKTDVLSFIEQFGVTREAAEILGKAEYAVNNTEAAFNSISSAIQMGSEDIKVYEIRAEMYERKGEMMNACADWSKAADLGSTNAAIKVRKFCGEYKKPEVIQPRKDSPAETRDDTVEVDETMDPPAGSGQEDPNADPSGQDEDSGGYEEEYSDPEEDLLIPREDNTPNLIEIDEDLSLTIFGQGLGQRKVLDRPSILILSDETGVVAVEVCVNANGKVDYAEFYAPKSTITKNSLVSLAIRKSKEFWFEKSDYPKMCGYVLFNIKGSE